MARPTAVLHFAATGTLTVIGSPVPVVAWNDDRVCSARFRPPRSPVVQQFVWLVCVERRRHVDLIRAAAHGREVQIEL